MSDQEHALDVALAEQGQKIDALGDAVDELIATGPGSGAPRASVVTGHYFVQPDDDTIIVGEAPEFSWQEVTLPSAVGIDGKQFTVANDADLVGITATDGQTIGGYLVRTLAGKGESLRVTAADGNWHVVGGNQEQFRTPKEWFVGGWVHAGQSGRSARTAFQTLGQAVVAASSGDTIYVCDDLPPEDAIPIDKAVRVVGLGNRPGISALKCTGLGIQLENLRISGGVNYKGVHLLLDGASQSSIRQVDVGAAPSSDPPTAYPTSAETGTGNGGIGVLVNNCEGVYFEELKIGGCSIGLGIGHEASTNQVTRMVISGCYQDIVGGLRTSGDDQTVLLPAPYAYGGGNGGGWTFTHFKDTVPAYKGEYPANVLPVIQFNGSGGHRFIAMDVSEGAYQVCEFDAGNTLIGCFSAPATVFKFLGNSNHVIHGGILGAGWVCDSDYNVFDGVVSHGVITGSGSHNTFRNVPFSQGTALQLQLTGVGNVFDDGCGFSATAGGTDPAGISVLGTRPKFQRAEAVVALDYDDNPFDGASYVTIDLRSGTYFTLDMISAYGGALTLLNPIDSGNRDPAKIMLVKEIALEIRNADVQSPGAITLGSLWKLAGPLTPPASGTRTVLKAMFNGTDFVELSRTVGIQA